MLNAGAGCSFVLLASPMTAAAASASASAAVAATIPQQDLIRFIATV